jgi:hypothetical protein
MDLYQQFQFAVLIVLFLGWVVSGTVCFITPEPSDFISAQYGKFEAMFLLLASLKAVESRISRTTNGERPEENKGDQP